MNHADIIEIMRELALLQDTDEAQSRHKEMISIIESMGVMEYDEFIVLYNELLDIIDTNEIIFTALFLRSFIHFYNEKKTKCFSREPIESAYCDSCMAYYEAFCTNREGQLRFFIKDQSSVPEMSNEQYIGFISMVEYRISEQDIPMNDADFVATLATLSICRIGALKYDYLEEVYAHFLSYLELLSARGDNQRARDSLEGLVMASEYDSIKYVGFISKFILAEKQKRNFESLFLLLFAWNSVAKEYLVHEKFFYFLNISTAQLFRNISAIDLSKNAYEYILNNFELDDYSEQQVTHSYLFCILQDNDESVIEKIHNYLNRNLSDILSYGSKSSLPWIALLKGAAQKFPKNKTILACYLEKLYGVLPPDAKNDLLNTLGLGDDVESSLYMNLNNIYKSRRSNDIAAHLKSISPLVNSAIRHAISSSNAKLLLASTVAKTMNSPYVSSRGFKNGVIQTVASDNASTEDFIGKIIGNIEKFSKQTTVASINSLDGSVFATIHGSNGMELSRNICKLPAIDTWVSDKLGELGFNESRKHKGRVEGFELFWEEDSRLIQCELPPFYVSSLAGCPESVFLVSSEVAKFPINLIRTHSDYVSSQMPVSLVMPSFFLEEGRRTIYSTDDVNLYYPRHLDPTVEMAIDVIDRNVSDYLTSKTCDISPKQGKISFFVGHGKRVGNKFSGVSFEDDGLLLPFEFARNLVGDIIVLFVCHAGFSANKIFSVDSYSLAKELLEKGAKHVIAPAWPLNIKLTGPWAKTFLDSLSGGETVSRSCFAANMKLKELFMVESAWAAMHHYQG